MLDSRPETAKLLQQCTIETWIQPGHSVCQPQNIGNVYKGGLQPNTKHTTPSNRSGYYSVITENKTAFRRKFNFKKARWIEFTDELDDAILNLAPDARTYDKFVLIVNKSGP